MAFKLIEVLFCALHNVRRTWPQCSNSYLVVFLCRFPFLQVFVIFPKEQISHQLSRWELLNIHQLIMKQKWILQRLSQSCRKQFRLSLFSKPWQNRSVRTRKALDDRITYNYSEGQTQREGVIPLWCDSGCYGNYVGTTTILIVLSD